MRCPRLLVFLVAGFVSCTPLTDERSAELAAVEECQVDVGGATYGCPDGGAGSGADAGPDGADADAGSGTPDGAVDADAGIDGGSPDGGPNPDGGTPDAPPDGPPMCTGDPPPLLSLPDFNRRLELKGKDSFDNEIKLGVEVRSEGKNGEAPCEASSSASLFGYLLVKILGQEAGFSFSGNGAYHVCETPECVTPPNYSCGGDSCTTSSAGGSLAAYRGVELDLCKKYIGKFGWIGKKLCSIAEVKASARIGVGVTAAIQGSDGVPTGNCATCCENGRSKGSLEAGPSGLVEGKASAKFKLWKFEIEVGIGAKGCAAVTGQVGLDCNGNPYGEPVFHGYAAICIETMVSPGGSFRILNNEAELCLPLGFWDFCTRFPRCWKTPTDAARACPSGSPNPE